MIDNPAKTSSKTGMRQIRLMYAAVGYMAICNNVVNG